MIPIEHAYEAMFIGGYWDEAFVRECEKRRLHCVRVPFGIEALRAEIAKAVSAARRAAHRITGES